MISPTLTLVVFFTVLLIPNYPGPYEEPPQQLLQSDQTWIFGGIFASTVGWRDFWALGKVVRNCFRTLFQLGAGPLQILTVTLKWAKKFCLRTCLSHGAGGMSSLDLLYCIRINLKRKFNFFKFSFDQVIKPICPFLGPQKMFNILNLDFTFGRLFFEVIGRAL